MNKLTSDFYIQNAITVAKKLPGKIMVRKINNQMMKTKIVETEAYYGTKDKASHAYQNKKTDRTRPMFLKGGHTYIYLIYGIHHCLNIVTGKKEEPEAVLIRAIEPLTNLEMIKQNRKIKTNNTVELTNGPGKLCEALSINKSLNEHDLTSSNKLYILDNKIKTKKIKKAPRINIDYAEDYKNKPWRFYIKENSYLSAK